MGFINNIRQAAQKYRAYRADIGRARQSINPRQRDKLNARAAITRREFLATSFRAARLPLTLTLAGSPIAYFILARKTETIKSLSKPNQIEYLKNMALNILQEVQMKKSMSPRYEMFINEIIRLIKANRIHFVSSRKLKYPAIYRHKNNTIIINPGLLFYEEIRFRAILIHELFHAYQDYQKKALPNSMLEAEAHLAKADFLYHQGQYLPETWLNIGTDPADEEAYKIGFNVPASIVKKIRTFTFTSPEYTEAIKIIADNYLKFAVYLLLLKSTLVERPTTRITLSGISRSQIEKNRRNYLDKIYKLPANQAIITVEKKRIGNIAPSVLDFLATSRALTAALWPSKKSEVHVLLSETFEEFKKILFKKQVDLSPIDKILVFSGIN